MLLFPFSFYLWLLLLNRNRIKPLYFLWSRISFTYFLMFWKSINRKTPSTLITLFKFHIFNILRIIWDLILFLRNLILFVICIRFFRQRWPEYFWILLDLRFCLLRIFFLGSRFNYTIFNRIIILLRFLSISIKWFHRSFRGTNSLVSLVAVWIKSSLTKLTSF